jgi:plastocyanin
MTAADKFGIAFSVGFTVALIAIALSLGTMGNTTQAPVAPTPMPPVEKPAPPVVEETPVEEVPEEETPMEDEAPTEETPEETPEDEAPVEEEPATEEETSGDEEMIMESSVSIPEGSSTPGCEADNACYSPAETTVSVGGTVTWTNNDTAAHTITSGTPTDGPDGMFDSSIVMSGATFEYTFEEAGQYDYFCIVHPWMTGKVTVE